jgi:hypothetical protein
MKLREYHKRVVVMLASGHSYAEIARYFNVSEERVRDVENQAHGFCPNDPAHGQIELAFYDDESGAFHWHCVTPNEGGLVCHAEWVTT